MAAMSEGRNNQTFHDPEEKKCVVSALYIATTKMCVKTNADGWTPQ